jgi:hypothetical protein
VRNGQQRIRKSQQPGERLRAPAQNRHYLIMPPEPLFALVKSDVKRGGVCESLIRSFREFKAKRHKTQRRKHGEKRPVLSGSSVGRFLFDVSTTRLRLGVGGSGAILSGMKKTFLISIAFGLLVAGCGDSSSKSTASTNSPTGGNLATAPVDYLNDAVKAQQKAVKTIDTASLDKAIDMFNVQKGRYPKDLNELVTEKCISEIPKPPYGTKIEYDAKSGSVSVVKQ